MKALEFGTSGVFWNKMTNMDPSKETTTTKFHQWEGESAPTEDANGH